MNFPRFAAWVVFVGVSICVAANAADKAKPNVLLICVDDLATTLGCYGNPIVKTPNVDRLASMGVKFDRAYCNYPICNPSRASMLSGRYPDKTGVFGNNTSPRAAMPDAVFLPEHFKRNGYYTAGIGKIFHGSFMDVIEWDTWMNPKEVEGADEGEGAGGGDKREERAQRRAAGAGKAKIDKGDSSDVPFPWRATDNKDEQEPDGQIATRAIEVMEENRDKPFFLAVGFHKPHVGHVAPKKYFEPYPSEKMPLPVEPPIAEQNIPKIAYTPKFYPDLTDKQKRDIISHYYSCVAFMDSQLGRVMTAMDRLKLWDNTIVVFWGDHGWHLGQHGGMWAKVSLMEESARIPFIIVAPGKKKDVVSPRPVQSIDIYPTLVDFCQLTQPAGLDGTSLLPLLDDPKRPWEKPAFCQVTRRGGMGRSIHTEKWTYIEWPGGFSQLYDDMKDPRQLTNLAALPRHKAIKDELSEKLKASTSSTSTQVRGQKK